MNKMVPYVSLHITYSKESLCIIYTTAYMSTQFVFTVSSTLFLPSRRIVYSYYSCSIPILDCCFSELLCYNCYPLSCLNTTETDDDIFLQLKYFVIFLIFFVTYDEHILYLYIWTYYVNMYILRTLDIVVSTYVIFKWRVLQKLQ